LSATYIGLKQKHRFLTDMFVKKKRVKNRVEHCRLASEMHILFHE